MCVQAVVQVHGAQLLMRGCPVLLCCWYSGSAMGPTTDVAMPYTEVL